jgi:hypothetical protein
VAGGSRQKAEGSKQKAYLRSAFVSCFLLSAYCLLAMAVTINPEHLHAFGTLERDSVQAHPASFAIGNIESQPAVQKYF